LQKQSSRPLKNNNNKRDKNLEKFGVQELTTVEQRELGGGWLWHFDGLSVYFEYYAFRSNTMA